MVEQQEIARVPQFILESEKSIRFRPGIFLVDGAKRSEFYSRLAILGLIRDQASTEYQLPGIETEIPEPGLRFAWLEITDLCNEKCFHCYGGFSSEAGNKVTQPLAHKELRYLPTLRW